MQPDVGSEPSVTVMALTPYESLNKQPSADGCVSQGGMAKQLMKVCTGELCLLFACVRKFIKTFCARQQAHYYHFRQYMYTQVAVETRWSYS